MEGIPREESTQLPSSNDPKGLWKGYPGKNPPESLPRTTRKGYGRDTQGRNPSIGGFRKNNDKDKDKDKDMDNLKYHHRKIWLLKDRDKGRFHQS
jgi:hypothetical protein